MILIDFPLLVSSCLELLVSAQPLPSPLEGRPVSILVCATVYVVSSTLLPRCEGITSYVTLIARLQGSVGHDVRAVVEILGAARCILGYALELFVGLERVVDCYNVEDQDDYDYAANE